MFHNGMIMSKSLHGKVSIVTGASRGIGRGIALRLAAEGSSVVLCARDQQLLDEAAAEIRTHGGMAETIAVDLRMPIPASVSRTLRSSDSAGSTSS